jgi:hypothetical protein
MDHLDNIIQGNITQMNLSTAEVASSLNHAKQIYIELLKLEYPAATETHKESLAKQAFIYALEFHKATTYF